VTTKTEAALVVALAVLATGCSKPAPADAPSTSGSAIPPLLAAPPPASLVSQNTIKKLASFRAFVMDHKPFIGRQPVQKDTETSLEFEQRSKRWEAKANVALSGWLVDYGVYDIRQVARDYGTPNKLAQRYYTEGDTEVSGWECVVVDVVQRPTRILCATSTAEQWTYSVKPHSFKRLDQVKKGGKLKFELFTQGGIDKDDPDKLWFQEDEDTFKIVPR
jgi:hypothetical protein